MRKAAGDNVAKQYAFGEQAAIDVTAFMYAVGERAGVKNIHSMWPLACWRRQAGLQGPDAAEIRRRIQHDQWTGHREGWVANLRLARVREGFRLLGLAPAIEG